MQLLMWYERPALSVAVDVEEHVHGLRRLQIVNAIMLDKGMMPGVFLWPLAYVVSFLRRVR